MDFITNVSTAQGFTTNWVVVDCFLKIPHFVPLAKLLFVPQMAQTFFKKILFLHGLPAISNHWVQFIFKFWRALCKALKLALHT